MTKDKLYARGYFVAMMNLLVCMIDFIKDELHRAEIAEHYEYARDKVVNALDDALAIINRYADDIDNDL